MKKGLFTSILALFLSLILCSAFAQAPAGKSKINPIKQVDLKQLEGKTLRGQYEYFLTKSYNYQQDLLSRFYKNMVDTLNIERRKITELRSKVATQTQAESSLKADVNSKEQSLTE